MTNAVDKKEPIRTWEQELTLWCFALTILISVIGVALYVFRVIPPIKLSPEDVSRIGYFDAATGEPKVYFKRQRNGKFDLFDRPGFHPNTQEPLEPVTSQNAQVIEGFVTSEIAQAKQLIAQREAEQKRQEDVEQKRKLAEANRLAAIAEATAKQSRDDAANHIKRVDLTSQWSEAVYPDPAGGMMNYGCTENGAQMKVLYDSAEESSVASGVPFPCPLIGGPKVIIGKMFVNARYFFQSVKGGQAIVKYVSLEKQRRADDTNPNPISAATQVPGQLHSGGKATRGRIGVTIQELTRELAESFGLSKPNGALISSVEKGGAADKAGIEASDVILKFDGKTVNNSADLPRMVATTMPGSKVIVELWRKGKVWQASVVIAETLENGKVIEGKISDDFYYGVQAPRRADEAVPKARLEREQAKAMQQEQDAWGSAKWYHDEDYGYGHYRDKFGKPYSGFDNRGYYPDGMLVPWGCLRINTGGYDCSHGGPRGPGDLR